jgi:hypothetical protein
MGTTSSTATGTLRSSSESQREVLGLVCRVGCTFLGSGRCARGSDVWVHDVLLPLAIRGVPESECAVHELSIGEKENIPVMELPLPWRRSMSHWT